MLNLLGGLAIAATGIFIAERMQLIITSFSLIGLIGAYQMYQFQRAAPADPRWWMREHIRAMIGNGVATHIAFMQIGLPKILPILSGPVGQPCLAGPLGGGCRGGYLSEPQVLTEARIKFLSAWSNQNEDIR